MGNKNNATPLFIAAQKNHVEVIKLLIENGADIFATKKTGEQPIFIAGILFTIILLIFFKISVFIYFLKCFLFFRLKYP